MAVLSPADVKAQIVLLVGDVDPVTGDPPVPASAGIVATNIDAIWSRYSSQSLIYPGLQALYVQRDATTMVLNVLRRRVDTIIDNDSVKRQQQAQALLKQLELLGGSIEQVEKAAANAGVPFGGPITRTVPQTVPEAIAAIEAADDGPIHDPNDPALSGSPYVARSRGSRGMRR